MIPSPVLSGRNPFPPVTGASLCFAFAAENVYDLVLVESFHLVARRSEIFAGSNSAGLSWKSLRTAAVMARREVGVDVDLADIHLRSLAEFLLRNTDGIGKLAAIFVDGLDIFLRNR